MVISAAFLLLFSIVLGIFDSFLFLYEVENCCSNVYIGCVGILMGIKLCFYIDFCRVAIFVNSAHPLA